MDEMFEGNGWEKVLLLTGLCGLFLPLPLVFINPSAIYATGGFADVLVGLSTLWWGGLVYFVFDRLR